MATRSITEQIEAIKIATAKASRSKETAIAFLRRAGIIEPDTAASRKIKSNHK